MTTERESFLARWARRKRETAVPEVEAPGGAPPAIAAPVGEDRERNDGDAPLAAGAPPALARPGPGADAVPELPLPSLDDVKPGGDLSAFLAAHVPETLRNAALQRMWRLDPLIRDFENPAREYAYNWNAPGGVPSYGPLPEGFDTEALLRRITGRGEEPEPEEVLESAPDNAVAVNEPPVVEAAETEAVARSAESDPSAPAASEPALPPPPPAPREETPPARRPAADLSPPSPGPRPRRHGGALPS